MYGMFAYTDRGDNSGAGARIMNEKITEGIVRDHFKKDAWFDKVIWEEQKSSLPRVVKLLRNASKSGTGEGKPEFYISFKKEHPNYIIIIECKAITKKHESKDHSKHNEYAVDGALLYASYLSKEYDVLAIAVSGETKKELMVSHYFQLRGENKAKKIFGDKLLSLEDYMNGYIGSQEKAVLTKDELIKAMSVLNEKLHAHKVSEDKRLLLLSGILIALRQPSFEKSYIEYSEPKRLAKALIEAVEGELEPKLSPEKVKIITTELGFIQTHATLSKTDKVLFNVIKEIDDSIKPFIDRNNIENIHDYDALSDLYVTFLRYANKDKAFGIVLTPEHIKKLFCDLAQINKNSILLDNCTGTSGFLISGMDRMVSEAKVDGKKKIDEIKNKQLIGVEQATHIYALACCNMFLHGDGKTNLIHGDCFKPEIIAEASKFRPNVGMLNPPYQSVKGDPSEIKFILNNLESLQSGGICVAIIPMERVLSTSGEGLENKKVLLKNHTLEAVMSMPNELFIDSDVGVVTAILVITAHKPHPSNKETYFGYWKDDGFLKKKNQGRIDLDGKWKDIKAVWLNSYENHKAIPGLSVCKKVTAEDEWCAEAYMETDYSNITKDEFVKTVKEFVVFQEMNLK